MRERPRVMVVDDDPIVLESWREALADTFDVVTFLDPLAAAHHVSDGEAPALDVALLDVRMPGMDGLSLLAHLRARQPDCEVILATAHGSIPMAVDALQAGAYDFLPKPVEDLEDAVRRIGRAAERRQLKEMNAMLARRLDAWAGEPELLGENRAVAAARAVLAQIAPSVAPVLVRGEPGTGKALAARVLHRRGRGSRGEPFVELDLAAKRDAWALEVELFGGGRQRGLIAAAGGGTLFLREVGDLPMPLQTRLLRELEREVGPDVRVIASTRHDLVARAARGLFRHDLLQRLATFEIILPPLRERRTDLPVLAHHFLRRASEREGRGWTGFADETLAVMARYPWPGNVRELDQAVVHALTWTSRALIEPEHLPPAVRTGAAPRPRRGVLEGFAPGTLASGPYHAARRRLLRDFEQRYFEDLLQLVEGNLSEAARRSGVDRSNLRRRLRQAGVVYDQFRPPDEVLAADEAEGEGGAARARRAPRTTLPGGPEGQRRAASKEQERGEAAAKKRAAKAAGSGPGPEKPGGRKKKRAPEVAPS